MKKIPCRLIVLMIIAILNSSCQNGQSSLKKEVQRFMNSEINIPALDRAYIEGRDTVIILDLDVSAKMVIFYDSTNCASCKLSSIREWQFVEDYAQAVRNKFKPIFIFAPSEDKERELIFSLRSHMVKWPIYIDSEQLFLSANPDFPKNKILHTFLLDRNNKVVLTGEPVNNDRLWELYKNTIKELIDNNGVLKE